MNYPDYQYNLDDYGSDVTARGNQLATYETIDEIKLCLKNLENARLVGLSAAHRALLDSITAEAYDQGLANLDSINNDIKAGFQLVNERLKWTPAQGVKTQLDQQWRNFRDEVEQYLKATSMFERRLKQQGEKYDQTNSDEQPSLNEQERVDGPLGAPLDFQTLSKKSMKQTRNYILQRSAVFKQIEQDLNELLLLFEHLNEIIRRQESTIADIESNAGRTADDCTNAAATLTGTVERARKIRKWKWYALTIMIVAVAIIVAVVVVFAK